MKNTIDTGRQRLERLLSQPDLVIKVAIIFSLFVLAMMLFGGIVGSLITVKFFPNTNL